MIEAPFGCAWAAQVHFRREPPVVDVDAITGVQQCLGQVPVVVTAIHQPLDGDATTNRRKATESRLLPEGIMMCGPLDTEQELL